MSRATVTEAGGWAPKGLRNRDVRLILGIGILAAAALVLWLGRGAGYSGDEIDWFGTSPHLDLHGALAPYNGHLILIPRLVYALMFKAFGVGYLQFRLIGFATVVLTVVLLFAFAARRVGALAALAPALVLLVYGSDSQHVLLGNAFGDLLPVVMGVGALLALEREDLPGDVAACLLLCLSVATFSVGLAFVAGAAVLILLDPDRRRRAWVFAVPALLYAAWFIWSRNEPASTVGNVQLVNLLLSPIWAADSLASVGQALVGLNYQPFGESWGPLVAAAFVAGLAWRLSRGAVESWLWAILAVPVTLWVIEAAAQLPPFREPDSPRYIFPASVCVLLVVAQAAKGVRLGRRAILILFAVAAVGLATNVFLLRAESVSQRAQALITRTDLAAVDIERGRLGSANPTPLLAPGIDPGARLWAVLHLLTTDKPDLASRYVEATREYGSPGYTPAELREQAGGVRDYGDQVLAGILGLQLSPAPKASGSCRRVAAGPGGVTTFQLPPGGAVITSRDAPAELQLRRFGDDFTVSAGMLADGSPMKLAVPSDAAPDPWYASASSNGVSVCALAIDGSTTG